MPASIDDIIEEIQSKKVSDLSETCWYSKIVDSNSKKCLIVLIDKSFSKNSDEGPIFFYSHPRFKEYCKNYEIDYIVLVSSIEYSDFERLTYEKFNVRHIAPNYERILLIDSDVIIRKQARNIFDYTDPQKVAIASLQDISKYYQVYYKRYLELYKNAYIEKFGSEPNLPTDIENSKYYSSGIIVFNTTDHLKIFDEPEIYIYEKNTYSEQCLINLRLFQYNFPIEELDKSFSGQLGPNFNKEKNIALFDYCDFVHFAGKNQEYRKINRISDLLEYDKLDKRYKPKRIVLVKPDYLKNHELNQINRPPEECYFDTNSLHCTYRGFLHFLKNVLCHKQIDRIVELFPGDGRLTKFFSEVSKEVIVIDFPENLKDSICTNLDNVSIIEGDPHKKTYLIEDNSLDLVYINNRIFNYYNWCSLLSQWFKKIKLNGILSGSGYVYNEIKNTLFKAITERFGCIDILYEDGTWVIYKNRSLDLPLVSVILPVYNSENWLTETLESLLNQTYQNFEVIIIDDCSLDKSSQIIESYKSKFKNRIRILCNPVNKGPAYCRNLGVEIALGEFILPVDSDNILRHDFIETCLQKLLQTESDIVYTNLKYFELKDGIWNTPENFTFQEIKVKNCLDNCSLIRRKVFENIKFDENLSGYIDWDFWIQAKSLDYKFEKNTDSYFYYRYRAGSIRDRAKSNEDLKEKILSKLSSKVSISVSRESKNTQQETVESKVSKIILERIRSESAKKQLSS